MTNAAHGPSCHVFDEEPGESELRSLLAPAGVAGRVEVREDDTSIVVRQRPWSFAAFAVLVLLLLTAATFAPRMLPGGGPARPGDVDRGALTTMAIALWLVVVPALFWLGRRARRPVPQLVDGVVVDKQRAELELPQLQLRVPRGRVVRFVCVEGRARRGTVVMRFHRCAVLFRDDQGRWVCASIAGAASRRAVRAAAQRLADFLDVSVQHIAAGPLRG